MGFLGDMLKKKSQQVQYEVRTSTQAKPHYFKTHQQASEFTAGELTKGSGEVAMREVPVQSNKKKKLFDMS